MDNHQLCNQDSGNCEYYTPPKIIAAAHMLLGTIDLDPASSPKANETVKATRIYTEADNGLSQPWEGNVWMNHPFSRQGNREWIGKLVEEYNNKRVYAAVCICFAAVNAQWFAPLLHFPQFFPAQRINYLYPDGTVARGVAKRSKGWPTRNASTTRSGQTPPAPNAAQRAVPDCVLSYRPPAGSPKASCTRRLSTGSCRCRQSRRNARLKAAANKAGFATIDQLAAAILDGGATVTK